MRSDPISVVSSVKSGSLRISRSLVDQPKELLLLRRHVS
jgi:hypothetical protein